MIKRYGYLPRLHVKSLHTFFPDIKTGRPGLNRLLFLRSGRNGVCTKSRRPFVSPSENVRVSGRRWFYTRPISRFYARGAIRSFLSDRDNCRFFCPATSLFPTLHKHPEAAGVLAAWYMVIRIRSAQVKRESNPLILPSDLHVLREIIPDFTFQSRGGGRKAFSPLSLAHSLPA